MVRASRADLASIPIRPLADGEGGPPGSPLFASDKGPICFPTSFTPHRRFGLSSRRGLFPCRHRGGEGT